MRELIGNAGISFMIRVLGALFSFIFNVMIGRAVGADGAGLYYLSLTVVAVSATIGRLGLDNVVLRRVAADFAAGRANLVAVVRRRAITAAALASVGISLLVIVSAESVARVIFHKSDLVVPLRILALSIPPVALYTLNAESLRAIKQIPAAAVFRGGGLPLLDVILLTITMTLVGGVMVEQIAAVHTSAAYIVFLGSVVAWRKYWRKDGVSADTASSDGLFRSAVPLLVVAVASMMMEWTDIILLGLFRESVDVGVYGAAIRTARLTTFILVAVNSIAAPRYAAFHDQSDYSAMQRYARRSAGLMIALSVPILLMLLVFPGIVLSLFGEQFIRAEGALRILALGQFVNAATGSVGFILMMSGCERSFRNIILVFLCVNIVLNILLIPRWGIVGAAVATSLTVSGQNLAATRQVKREIGIQAIPVLPESSEFNRRSEW